MGEDQAYRAGFYVGVLWGWVSTCAGYALYKLWGAMKTRRRVGEGCPEVGGMYRRKNNPEFTVTVNRISEGYVDYKEAKGTRFQNQPRCMPVEAFQRHFERVS